MKKTLLFCTAAVILLCSFDLKGLFGSKQETAPAETVLSEAQTQGNSAGKALHNLYTQYKADGKFDAKNLNNILNTVSLINSCSDLKENIKNTSFLKDFGIGLVLGSNNLVTNDNSDIVTEQLGALVSNIDSEKMNDAAQKAGAVMESAGQIAGLLNLFK